MSIAGSDYGLVVFFAKLNYAAVKIAQILVILCFFICDKESVVGYGLNFKVIVEINYLLDLGLGLVFKNSGKELSRLTRRADYQALAVLFKLGLGDSRVSLVILQKAV